MSINYSSGTAAIEHILMVNVGKFTIGTALTDALGTSDIRRIIEDGERYIDAMIDDTTSSTPVSPTPNALRFASDYFSAYLVHSQIFAANKPGEQSEVVNSWREMAEKAIEAYKRGYQKNIDWAGIHSYKTKIFTQRGVQGIGDGVLDDDSDAKTTRKS